MSTLSRGLTLVFVLPAFAVGCASDFDALFAQSPDASMPPAEGGSEGGSNADGPSAMCSEGSTACLGAHPNGCCRSGETCCSGQGNAQCCQMNEMCTSQGTCCILVPGSCGQGGNCCGTAMCTTAQNCAPSCGGVAAGCATNNDCCLGVSYCPPSDSGTSCVACKMDSVSCTQDYECCGGHCSGSSHMCFSGGG